MAEKSGRSALELLFFALCPVALCFSVNGKWTAESSMYAQQALALLRGHIYITEPLPDVASYGGHWFVPFPPFPALLLVPLVALFGLKFPVVAVSAVLIVVDAWVLRRIARRLGAEQQAGWVVVALLLGTAYWPCWVASHDPWFFAHVVAVTMLLLALWAMLLGRSGYLVGALLGCAFLTRQLCIYSVIFCLVFLVRRIDPWDPWPRLRRACQLSGVVALFVGLYLVWNWMRFGNPFETGYGYLVLDRFLKERVLRHGLFSLAYVPFNALYLFVQGFHVSFGSETMLALGTMNPFGTSLVCASPFLLFAFLARWRKSLLWGAWITVALAAAHSLTYYNNGYNQINGQRFTLDYLPVLMLLCVRGLPKTGGRLWKGLVVYAVLLNVFALVVVPWANR